MQYRIARGTVVEAFEQLASEGYLRSSVGAGTFVNETLPETLLEAERRRAGRHPRNPPTTAVTLSRRGRALTQGSPFAGSAGQPSVPRFDPHLPALDEFPIALWARLLARRMRASNRELLDHGEPRGYLPLRRSISHYLSMTRGIRSNPEQILVLASVQQALDLSSHLLLNEGDAVWMEDPGYPGARSILSHSQARLVPVPVDDAGIQIDSGKRNGKGARMAYVTPARQAPLGVGLALSRRIELLDWAAQSSAWVFEDDYDGEFRYRGRPLAALQSIDRHGRVIYAGSFSKTLFPALRISYLVIPDALVDAFTAARSTIARFAPLLEQAALADFIDEGHYARHLRRMNTLYADRRAAMLDAIAAAPRVFDSTTGDEAGLSVVAWLKPGLTERMMVHAARARGLFVQPLKPYVVERPQRPGLILGFAAAKPSQIRQAIKSLAADVA